jgi:prephenate dehydrogenase
MDPEAHDQLLARTSHLPHCIAAALAATVGRPDPKHRVAFFCGSGFRDSTRIAEGSSEVWGDIVTTNRENLVNELRAFRDVLDRLVQAAGDADPKAIQEFLNQARAIRRALVSRSP